MLDFFTVGTRTSHGMIEVYPRFLVGCSEDLMIRGGDFYAVWDEEEKLWSTSEQTALTLIDQELRKYAESHKNDFGDRMRVLYIRYAETGMIDSWHKFVKQQLRDNWHTLDERIIFSNEEVTKKDYASKKVPYPLIDGPREAYETLISTLYSEEERHKIEWAIGAILTGESKSIQKFLVFYGDPGSGKGTILNLISDLCEGYCTYFDAKSVTSSNAAFALEPFAKNPLVAIQHDGNLSKIEENARLNSLVSHEPMTMNEKHKSQYSMAFNAFLLVGSNEPVKITSAKSGLIRRLIDVTPTGNKIEKSEYDRLFRKLKFELGSIAHHCIEVYNSDKNAYEGYVSTSMMGVTNDFYDFIMTNYETFKADDGTSLMTAFKMYKEYCEEANIPASQRMKKTQFKSELRNYFVNFEDRARNPEGVSVWNYYSGFNFDKFEKKAKEKGVTLVQGLDFRDTTSLFDREFADCKAQYAREDNEAPIKKWEDVTTRLRDLDTSKLHYVLIPEGKKLVTVDFDLKDASGKKSYEKNRQAASSWPKTYGELSKSGAGIHLEYFYGGDDISELARDFAEGIEIKTYKGGTSLRRKLTKCNNLPIATITTGLPKKEKKKMVTDQVIKSEKALRMQIERNLRKEIHSSTACSVDFIKKILDDAYESGLVYNVSDMKPSIFSFAARSTHQADRCKKVVLSMKFISETPHEEKNEAFPEDGDIVIFDTETWINFFLICWKQYGEGKPVNVMVNPSKDEVDMLRRFKLVGYNNRKYDNHILYGRILGDTNEDTYNRSRRIIMDKDKTACFGAAYNFSYTDVLDYAKVKQSLKKWEIDLDVPHQEMPIPWDKPIPEDMIPKAIEYCKNDVLATEAVFNATQSDFAARCGLAAVVGMTPNDTTNSLTTRIIFGKEKHPKLVYSDLATGLQYQNSGEVDRRYWKTLNESAVRERTLWKIDCDGLSKEDRYFKDRGVWYHYKKLSTTTRAFPGYDYRYDEKDGQWHNYYHGEDLGFGGYVYAEHGMYYDVKTFDVASEHPHSIKELNLFGEYTARFVELIEARIAIKHKDFEKASKMLNGALAPFLKDKDQADAIAGALKLAINSVYGLTSAKFDNPFRDIANVNNIVALRGAMFMVDAKHAIKEHGHAVIHCKTDSCKVVNPDAEISEFVMNFGKEYGYTFEIEHSFDRICLVNNAVYIAKLADDDESLIAKRKKAAAEDKPEPTPWTATGAQFQHPYVFKTLFSKEPLDFKDYRETKSVNTALYLDCNEDYPDVSEYEAQVDKLKAKIRKEEKVGGSAEVIQGYQNEITSLSEKIPAGHNYIHVGKVGSFIPVRGGMNGGRLLREKDGLYYSATGADGYRWLDAETVDKALNLRDVVDERYFRKLIDDAVDNISKFGDFEAFAS